MAKTTDRFLVGRPFKKYATRRRIYLLLMATGLFLMISGSLQAQASCWRCDDQNCRTPLFYGQTICQAFEGGCITGGQDCYWEYFCAPCGYNDIKGLPAKGTPSPVRTASLGGRRLRSAYRAGSNTRGPAA